MSEEPPKEKTRYSWRLLKRLFLSHQNVLFFWAGFLFDALTIDRIDAWLDLLIQGLYIGGLTLLILLQQRVAQGLWSPSGRLEKAWAYNLEALHFLFGGLLSAYVILYTRSGVNVRTFLFFAAAAGLLLYNELPEARRWGLTLRLALYTFCVASFQIYFVPVLAGRMGDGVFGISILVTAVLVGLLVALLNSWETGSVPALPGLAAPVVLTLSLISVFYYMRWIPPVPLEMKFVGVYHKVERQGGEFLVRFQKGPWYAFLRKQDVPYYARTGDRIYCFVRIFAPTRFEHKISLHWLQRETPAGWVSRDRIDLPIQGGRAEGYRGYAYKGNFNPGSWKIQVETEDGRVLGETTFNVELDPGRGKRSWATVRM